ncbi:MAG: acyl-CoA thioesterase [Clostridia bacterium]|nr:acyl-CoA thioesterase [Clostridia bacterium]
MKKVSCFHKVKYYETDKMGIVHHSHYIRWMEEARLEFLRENGLTYKTLEENGVISPVVSVSCRYKTPCGYDDDIRIDVSIKEYSGVKLVFEYEMTNIENGKCVATGNSEHCFVSDKGKVIIFAKSHPQYDEILKNLIF